MNPDLEIKKQLEREQKQRYKKYGMLVNSVLIIIGVKCHSNERQNSYLTIGVFTIFLPFST